jgi:hypothetical protein
MRGRDTGELKRQTSLPVRWSFNFPTTFRGIEMKIKLALGALAVALALSACSKREEAPVEPTPAPEATPPAEPAPMPESTPVDPNAPPADPNAPPADATTPPAETPPSQ